MAMRCRRPYARVLLYAALIIAAKWTRFQAAVEAQNAGRVFADSEYGALLVPPGSCSEGCRRLSTNGSIVCTVS